MDRCEVVDSLDRPDFESFVTMLEREPVNELNETGNGLATLQMGTVDALNPTGCLRQLERPA